MHLFLLLIGGILLFLTFPGVFGQVQFDTLAIFIVIVQSLMLFLIILWLQEVSDKLSVLTSINKKLKNADAGTDER